MENLKNGFVGIHSPFVDIENLDIIESEIIK